MEKWEKVSYTSVFYLSLKLFNTTDIELSAIAKAAKAGLKAIPNSKYNIPAAEGIIKRL